LIGATLPSTLEKATSYEKETGWTTTVTVPGFFHILLRVAENWHFLHPLGLHHGEMPDMPGKERAYYIEAGIQ
jgi:hypothetical protein